MEQLNGIKIIVAPCQSEKTCTGCLFNHGDDDIGCHKFDDMQCMDIECYDNERHEHLIFKLEQGASK